MEMKKPCKNRAFFINLVLPSIGVSNRLYKISAKSGSWLKQIALMYVLMYTGNENREFI
jgi:hypothetical protein